MDSETKPIRTYWYVAWFRDTTQPADDQDYEWPDCMRHLQTSLNCGETSYRADSRETKKPNCFFGRKQRITTQMNQ